LQLETEVEKLKKESTDKNVQAVSTEVAKHFAEYTEPEACSSDKQ
jgi:hypothetical protein